MPRGPMGGRRAVEEPHDFGKVMGKLVNYCRNYLPVIIIALILGAAGTVCQIVGPDKLKDMTNEIVKGLPAIVNGRPVMNSVDFGTVGHIAWTLVALYVGYAVLGYVQSWMMANVTQRTAQRLRESISVKINKLPLKYFDKVSYGDVLSRITNDVDAIGQTLGQSLGSLITSVTLFVGALVMMFYNNVIMTLCAIGASLIGLIIMMAIMKSSQKYFARQQMALGDVNGHVEEMYAGHLIVKAYNGEADSIRRFEKYNSDLYESGWKSQFLSGLMMPLMNIVGPTGAGKTTMVNLLMRFYEISGGSISIDGVDTKSVPRWNVHDQFSMVLQDTWVFRGTVRENIAYSKPGVTNKQIEDACKAVGLDHFIRSLPDGYDTVLDDKSSLSQGQKQLLTIARAMVQDAPILILDEATSSVDTRTEELIQKAMDALTVGRTSFVIAHRLSTIRDADMILVMNHGDVIERGTHDELLAAGGFYADLYNSQLAILGSPLRGELSA